MSTTDMSAEILMDLRERMVRIETKLDNTADHDQRLTDLEGRVNLFSSIGAILLAIVTFFQEPITRLFLH